jgi:hypothetical protein
MAIAQVSVPVHLATDGNPERQILAATEYLITGAVVRVYVNGVRPHGNTRWVRDGLRYDFDAGSGNPATAVEWVQNANNPAFLFVGDVL